MEKQKITSYIDGACSNNPGKGGWGVVIILDDGDTSIFLCGSDNDTTNNRMELTSAIKLMCYFSQPSQITVYTDSQYLKNGITTWIYSWKKNYWLNSSKKPVKNTDLWKDLLSKSEKHDVTWKWVKGHSDDLGNNIADSLAVNAKKF